MLNTIAFIPDGNRRYAKKNGLSFLEAYNIGFNTAEKVFDWTLKLPDIKVATIYALSTENLRRKKTELTLLSSLFDKYFRQLAKHPKIHDNEVKVKIIGRKEEIPSLKDSIGVLEDGTQDYDKYELNIALGYGGRDELIRAFNELKTSGEPINEETVKKHLYMTEDIDLLVRTGSSQRLSNFLTWQTAYSELYFTPKLWGEYDETEFKKSIDFYENTQRNFGK
jgi:undecaprenyl diphosphate synthase